MLKLHSTLTTPYFTRVSPKFSPSPSSRQRRCRSWTAFLIVRLDHPKSVLSNAKRPFSGEGRTNVTKGSSGSEPLPNLLREHSLFPLYKSDLGPQDCRLQCRASAPGYIAYLRPVGAECDGLAKYEASSALIVSSPAQHTSRYSLRRGVSCARNARVLTLHRISVFCEFFALTIFDPS